MSKEFQKNIPNEFMHEGSYSVCSVQDLLSLGVKNHYATEYHRQFSHLPTPRLAKSKTQRILFLAQTLYESAYFSRIVEQTNYSQQRAIELSDPQNPSAFWKKHHLAILNIDWSDKQSAQRELINIVYGGRMGNTNKDDGWKFRGRGLIQITGKNNYVKCATYYSVTADELVEKFESEPYKWAVLSAYWYWDIFVYPKVQDAERDLVKQCDAATRAINYGTNSYKQRSELALKIESFWDNYSE